MKSRSALLALAGGHWFSLSAFSQGTNLWVFLCFRQSNMESGGRIEEQDRTVGERFRVMADFDAPNRGWQKGKWHHAVLPLAAKGSGICMADYFGSLGGSLRLWDSIFSS